MMMENNFDQKLLESIKDKKIHPIPRWRFIIKEYGMWIFGFLLLLVGGFFVSLIIHMSRPSEFEIYGRTGRGPINFLLVAVPLFWLALLIGFSALLYLDIKKTKKGYRYSTLWILVTVILGSAGLGTVFYACGIGERLDDEIGQRAPAGFYNHIINPNVQFWASPEEGRLAGLIISQDSGDQYIVIDVERAQWILDTEGAKMRSIDDVQVGRPVRALGSVITDHEFKATEILPVKVGKGFFIHLKPIMGPGGGSMPGGEIHGVPGMIDAKMDQEFSGILEKYPDLKKAFIEDLTQDENIKDVIKSDPQFIIHLKALNINEETINALEK